MEEFKPCPFCGSTNIDISSDSYYCYYVVCHECYNRTHECNNKVDVIERWNRRVF